MKLEDLGYTAEIEKSRVENNLEEFELGRILAEHRERYIVGSEKGEFEAEITGNLRYSARSREDFPAVGDWVALRMYDAGSAIIHSVLPRSSVIKRQAVGQFGEIQVLAANIDFAFLVQAVDRDFSINRLERYLALCYSSGVKPVVLLSKIDLADEQQRSGIMESVKQRVKKVPLIAVSNEDQTGYEAVKNLIQKGKTYCLLGSSGVGKSTLLNKLAGTTVMKTGAISTSINRGKHVTSHRELFVLESGGIFVDNPGMREVGIADLTDGLENTFDTIARFSQDCRYSDCTHTGETGCSVLAALEKGEIDRYSYDNYLKLVREKQHFESTVAERRKKDKAFGKMLKNYKKDSNKKFR